MEKKLVSIIIPVHNAGSYLADTLDSVAACTYRPLEVVFYDDCSTDSSLKIIEAWQTKMLNNKIDIDITIGKSTDTVPGGKKHHIYIAHTYLYIYIYVSYLIPQLEYRSSLQ